MLPKPKRTKKQKPNYKGIYAEIWDEREHRCVNCGIDIPYQVVHNFSHKHSKGERPDLKLDKDNIELLCSTVNRNYDIGCHELHHTNPEAFKKRQEVTQ